MRTRVDASVFQVVPDFRRAVVSVRVHQPFECDWKEELMSRLAATTDEVRMGSGTADESWAEAFRAFGVNPNKFPPAHLNLRKRIVKGWTPPFINSFVAALNLASLTYSTPAGGDDVAALATLGEVAELTLARGGERFEGLGGADPIEVSTGELAYLCADEIVSRFGFVMNSKVTALDESTTTALINVDAIGPDAAKTCVAGAGFLQALFRSGGAEVAHALLTPDSSEWEVGRP